MSEFNYKKLLTSCIAMCEDSNWEIDMQAYIVNRGNEDHIVNESLPSVADYVPHIHSCGTSACWIGYSVCVFPNEVKDLGGFEQVSGRLFNIDVCKDNKFWVYLFGSSHVDSAALCGIRLLYLMHVKHFVNDPFSSFIDDDSAIYAHLCQAINMPVDFYLLNESDRRVIILPVLKSHLNSYD